MLTLYALPGILLGPLVGALADRMLVGNLLVFGAGSGLVTPTLFAGLSSLAPDHLRGGVMSPQAMAIGFQDALLPVSGGEVVCLAAFAALSLAV